MLANKAIPLAEVNKAEGERRLAEAEAAYEAADKTRCGGRGRGAGCDSVRAGDGGSGGLTGELWVPGGDCRVLKVPRRPVMRLAQLKLSIPGPHRAASRRLLGHGEGRVSIRIRRGEISGGAQYHPIGRHLSSIGWDVLWGGVGWVAERKGAPTFRYPALTQPCRRSIPLCGGRGNRTDAELAIGHVVEFGNEAGRPLLCTAGKDGGAAEGQQKKTAHPNLHRANRPRLIPGGVLTDDSLSDIPCLCNGSRNISGIAVTKRGRVSPKLPADLTCIGYVRTCCK